MTSISSQFLEFWGTFLLNAAKGQKQLDQMADWLKKGLPSADKLADVFSKYYGLERFSNKSLENADEWQQAIRDFEVAFKQYAEFWGWIPRTEYEQLKERCETLEHTVKNQAQTINQLRKILEAKGLGSIEMVERFQSIVKDQSEQFETLMENLGQAFSTAQKGKVEPKTGS